jgi:segregation and condensation protein A
LNETELAMAYKVKLDIFEGPFDLLVYLIEHAEMSIYDIKISEITNQYLQYVEHLTRRDTILAGEFMVLAASLIEIKSKMLLPRTVMDGSGDLLEDPRSELVQRLLEYKKYKMAAEALTEQEELASRIFTKPKEDISIYTENPEISLNIDLSQFVKSFETFLYKKKKIEEVQREYTKVERQRMSIEARIEQMKNLFRGKKKLRFHDLLEGETGRYHIVLTFLSVLELIRLKSVKARQAVNFGEIVLTMGDKDMPQDKGESDDDK